jgi:large subunit ribosomal protein L27
MAHTKAQGAAARTVNIVGKRLGIKKFAGEFVNSGSIIVRQRGTKFHAGVNTKMGRDFTLFASKDGFVSFRQMTGFHRTQKFVDVLEKTSNKDAAKKVTAKAVKSAPKTGVKAEVKPAAKTTKVAKAVKASPKAIAKKAPAKKAAKK